MIIQQNTTEESEANLMKIRCRSECMMTPLKISRSGSRRSRKSEVTSVPYLGASNAYNSRRYFRDIIAINPHEYKVVNKIRPRCQDDFEALHTRGESLSVLIARARSSDDQQGKRKNIQHFV